MKNLWDAVVHEMKHYGIAEAHGDDEKSSIALEHAKALAVAATAVDTGTMSPSQAWGFLNALGIVTGAPPDEVVEILKG